MESRSFFSEESTTKIVLEDAYDIISENVISIGLYLTSDSVQIKKIIDLLFHLERLISLVHV